MLAAFAFVVAAIAFSAPVAAQTGPPWDGNPVSHGLGPTYGEEWCAPVGNENVPQSDPLAIIPYGAITCTLDQFEDEAAAAGVLDRLSYEVIGQSAGGREIFGVVVNALDTADQQRDYARWQQLRELMLTDPAAAESLLASWGENVKLPIFVEANIHGGERESTDAMMQVVRDLVTLPYGTNDNVDDLLDHAILILIPTTNPDGRVAGRRTNDNAFDLNRDFLVQSQPEVRANTAFQLDWLAPVGLYMHGYYNPTLVDGLTKPHNPGLEYDKFLYWNQRRLDANDAAIEAIGRTIQRPVNQWNQHGSSGTTNGGPDVAEGWDDWGPFYSQTYGAFFGVDGSTVEMCDDAACGGRLGSKREQYVIFYSSADFWIENRERHPRRPARDLPPRRDRCGRGRTAATTRSSPSRGFTEDQHNWMVEYPEGVPDPVRRESAVRSHRPRASEATPRPTASCGGCCDNGVDVDRTDADLVRGTGRRTRRAPTSSPMEQALPRLRLHGPGRRAGHLRPHQPALRAAGRLEPRLAVGRGRASRSRPGTRSFAPATAPVAGRQPAPGRSAQRPGRLVRRHAQGVRRAAGGPRPAAKRGRRRGGGSALPERFRRAPCRPARSSSRTMRPRWPRWRRPAQPPASTSSEAAAPSLQGRSSTRRRRSRSSSTRGEPGRVRHVLVAAADLRAGRRLRLDR